MTATEVIPGAISEQLPEWDQPVRYIDRTHAWYNALGTNNPYQYAHFLDVPFQAMSKPLRNAVWP